MYCIILRIRGVNMKRCFLVLILSFAGIMLFAQGTDMSTYLNDFTRIDNSFTERLDILQAVQDAGLTGIAEFYHDALKYVLFRNADIKTRQEHSTAEATALILVQALGAEKYEAAALELWETVSFFDIEKDLNEGTTMREACIALGQVGGHDYVPHMAQRLDQFNAELITNPETRRRVQLVVVGLVNALETLKDHAGFRPVFNTAIGSYDPAIKQMAYNALINISEDPADIIIEIIHDPVTTPAVIQEAVDVMNRSNAPDESRAKVAAATLIAAWGYHTTSASTINLLSRIRLNAIDDIHKYGVADDAVYRYLERSYLTNFHNANPDYDEIIKTLGALAAVKTDQAVRLLYNFLIELNERRRTGPWDRRERQVFEWVVNCLQLSGTQAPDVRMLLTSIQRNERFTSAERRLAQNALAALASGGN
jgi:hypothetical protein